MKGHCYFKRKIFGVFMIINGLTKSTACVNLDQKVILQSALVALKNSIGENTGFNAELSDIDTLMLELENAYEVSLELEGKVVMIIDVVKTKLSF
ncbi:MAG: hypothetical protein KDK69_01755 [Chlamydiia bacterium]|nr:hypothetical protein [Chlamydiia bacterium]